jgi:STAS-like domain of unknown function (DUF4325)
MRYTVHEITGPYAISFDDGQQLFDLIHPQLIKEQVVELDFAEVKVFASAFFNIAIGQLLQDIPTETLNKYLVIMNLPSHGAVVLEQVIENAKLYYSDPSQKEAVDTVMEEYAASF